MSEQQQGTASDDSRRTMGEKKQVMEFKEVLSRVFPLAADPLVLQELIDTTLNFQEGYYFKVTTPFVYMQLISYGEMFDDSWSRLHTSQRELLFMVPIDWFKRVDNPEEKDKDHLELINGSYFERDEEGRGSVTPFIYVDNDLSVLVGRERFGWPKNLMSVIQTDAGWVDKMSPQNKLVGINVRSLKNYYVGEQAQENTLLEIWRSPGTMVTLSKSMIAAQFEERLGDLKHLVDTQFWLGRYLLDVWQKFKGTGDVPILRLEEYLASITENMQRYMGNCIGVKEFRDVDNPELMSYLAIACSHARVTEVMGVGLLGSLENVLTTISGGYSIRVNTLESYPLVEKLGLRVERIVTDDQGDPIQAVLAPVMPFWLKANVEYYAGNDVFYESAHGVPLDPELPMTDLPRMSHAFVPPEGN